MSKINEYAIICKARSFEKLREFIDWAVENLTEKQFDFSRVVSEQKNGCDSVCCLIGWLPEFDERVTWTEESVIFNDFNDLDYDLTASEILEIPVDDALRLFTPDFQELIRGWERPNLTDDSTLAECLDGLRYYIEIKS